MVNNLISTSNSSQDIYVSANSPMPQMRRVQKAYMQDYTVLHVICTLHRASRKRVKAVYTCLSRELILNPSEQEAAALPTSNPDRLESPKK
jgi:hypothetical protein